MNKKRTCNYKRIAGLSNDGKVFLSDCGHIVIEKSQPSRAEQNKREYRIFKDNYCTRCGGELSFSDGYYKIEVKAKG